MKKSDFDTKNSSTEELKNKLEEIRFSYARIKIAHRVNPVENPMNVRELRRSIAFLETELRSRQ